MSCAGLCPAVLLAGCPVPSPGSLVWGGCLFLPGLVGVRESGARVSCAFGGGPWHLGCAGWCPTWPSGLFAVPWRLRCSRPFSLGALTTSVGRGCACWLILDLRGDFRHWCRLSLFLRKYRDIWSSGLYGVCVPVIWASLIGVELFMQHKLLH